MLKKNKFTGEWLILWMLLLRFTENAKCKIKNVKLRMAIKNELMHRIYSIRLP